MKELQKKELHLLKIIIKKREPSHGSGQWNNNQNSSYRPNSYYGQENQNRGRLLDRRSDQSPSRNDGNRSNIGTFNSQGGTWRKNGNFSRSPSGQGRDFSQGNSFRRLHTPFSLEIRHLVDQMLTQSLVPLMNRNFRKATIKHQRTWFVSPLRMIALMNYRNFVR